MTAPERAIVSVLRNGRRVGMAFHVGNGLLVTCAHVVNTALGRAKRDATLQRTYGSPVEPTLGRSSVRSVVVRNWWPESADTFDERDVAILSFVGTPPPDLSTLGLDPSDRPTGEVQALGPTEERTTPGHVRGVVLGAVDDGRLQVNQQIEGVYRIGVGFSGGPVWRPNNGAVVGVLQSRRG
jgi:hypothetical protein